MQFTDNERKIARDALSLIGQGFYKVAELCNNVSQRFSDDAPAAAPAAPAAPAAAVVDVDAELAVKAPVKAPVGATGKKSARKPLDSEEKKKFSEKMIAAKKAKADAALQTPKQCYATDSIQKSGSKLSRSKKSKPTPTPTAAAKEKEKEAPIDVDATVKSGKGKKATKKGDDEPAAKASKKTTAATTTAAKKGAKKAAEGTFATPSRSLAKDVENASVPQNGPAAKPKGKPTKADGKAAKAPAKAAPKTDSDEAMEEVNDLSDSEYESDEEGEEERAAERAQDAKALDDDTDDFESVGNTKAKVNANSKANAKRKRDKSEAQAEVEVSKQDDKPKVKRTRLNKEERDQANELIIDLVREHPSWTKVELAVEAGKSVSVGQATLKKYIQDLVKDKKLTYGGRGKGFTVVEEPVSPGF